MNFWIMSSCEIVPPVDVDFLFILKGTDFDSWICQQSNKSANEFSSDMTPCLRCCCTAAGSRECSQQKMSNDFCINSKTFP